MRSVFTIITLVGSLCQLLGQITITGNINDENGLPVPYASAALIQSKDSSLVRGSLTDETGLYTIEHVGTGTYRIFAAYMGYESVYSQEFEIKNENKSAVIDINFLQKGILLDETVIVAKRPFLEQKSDRLIVNVASSAIAAGGTAMEILQKVPGIILIQDKVTLGGSQNLQVWIDGKPSQYTDMNALLRDMPGDQIEKIELITQPGAQFDAAGGPILNVVLKRNADLGFKGTASFSVGGYSVDQSDVNQGIKNYHRINPSLNLTYRSGKINLFGNAAFNQGDYFDVIKVNRYIGQEVYKSFNFDESEYTFKNLRVGGDYYMNDKTTIGTIFRVWDRKGNGEAFNTTSVFNNDESVLYTIFNTDNFSNSRRGGTFNNVYLKHEFDKKTGHMLTIDVDYNTFTTRNINDLVIYPDDNPTAQSLSKQDIDQPVNILVTKADYKLPVDSTFKVEAGVKASFAEVDNDLNFYRAGIRSPNESNNFLYKENINAGYINLSKSLQKLEFNAGLRAEQTIVSGTTMGIDTLNRNYLQWFPSASALYRLNKNMALQSSYARRVNRPGFQQQNPFSKFIDSLTYTRGNPNLKPEITNTAQLNLTYDGQPFFGISYATTDDVIIENAPKLEGTKTFTTVENLASNQRLEIQLNFPIKLGKHIDGFGGNQAIYNRYNANYLGVDYKASRWHWLAYWQINASLPGDFKMEVGGFYMTKFLEEFLTIDNMAGVNIGVSKSFANKNGRVSLSWNDIFYSQNTDAVIDFNDIRVNFFQRQYSRNLRLSVSYTFGNTKVKNISGRTTASESESSRVKLE